MKGLIHEAQMPPVPVHEMKKCTVRSQPFGTDTVLDETYETGVPTFPEVRIGDVAQTPIQGRVTRQELLSGTNEAGTEFRDQSGFRFRVAYGGV